MIAWILDRTSFTAVVVRLRGDKIVRRWGMMLSVYGDVVWSRIPLCRGGGRYIIIRLAELAFRAYVFVMSYPRIVTSSPEYRKRSSPTQAIAAIANVFQLDMVGLYLDRSTDLDSELKINPVLA